MAQRDRLVLLGCVAAGVLVHVASFHAADALFGLSDLKPVPKRSRAHLRQSLTVAGYWLATNACLTALLPLCCFAMALTDAAYMRLAVLVCVACAMWHAALWAAVLAGVAVMHDAGMDPRFAPYLLCLFFGAVLAVVAAGLAVQL